MYLFIEKKKEKKIEYRDMINNLCRNRNCTVRGWSVDVLWTELPSTTVKNQMK